MTDGLYGKFKYTFYRPSDAEKLPLIVVLHGSGEIGSSLSKLKKREPYISLNNGKCTPDACVLMPQLPNHTWGTYKGALKDLIDYIATENKCDMSNISITGHSLGANGAMDMLLAYPDYFTAASILSPCKDYGNELKAITHIPLWFLYGAKETTFKKYAQSMAKKFAELGGETRETSVPGYGHAIQFVWVSDKYNMFDWLTSFTTESDKDKNLENGGEIMFTGKQLAAYCEEMYAHKEHWAYWYGTYGKLCTKSLYESKKKQYPDHYGSDRTSGYMKDIEEKRRCADCVGMIKSFFWTGGVYDTDPKYAINGCPDKSANGLYKMCKKNGPIKTIPDIPGVVVWKSGHIGVYVGGGYTVEMKGFAYDCVRNKVEKGPWTNWGMLPDTMIKYDDEPTPVPKLGERDLKKGCEGQDVAYLQADLMRLGYSLPKYGTDGDFGETEKAVKAFQKDYGLKVDGVMNVGEDYDVLFKALESLNRYVEITGNSVNVRSAPGTDSTIIGVAHNGDLLPYQGVTKNVNNRDWYLVEFENQNGWVSSKYARLTDSGKRGTKIVDISKYQPTINYDALIADTALIILRAGYRSKDGGIYEDQKVEKHGAALIERGVRFGVYFYSIADSEDKAREEARMFFKYANKFNPLFWAMDAEKTEITKEAIVAFIDELRKLGATKVGCYVANHLYTKYDYASIRDQMDYTWIPKYKSDPPKYPCDLWQYTSTGQVNGIDEGVDLSRITGQGHDLTWFTS